MKILLTGHLIGGDHEHPRLHCLASDLNLKCCGQRMRLANLELDLERSYVLFVGLERLCDATSSCKADTCVARSEISV